MNTRVHLRGHHVTQPEAFNNSLYTTAKPGARLAIIEAAPGEGSQLPAGVPANRGGHGVPTAVVIDQLTAAGVVYVRTIQDWSPGDEYPTVLLMLFETGMGRRGPAPPMFDSSESVP